MNKYKVAILVTHPIQYYVPLYRALHNENGIDLTVFYCHKQTAHGQSEAGFRVEFEWDIPILEGYKYKFLNNISKKQSTDSFFGCDTPEIIKIINLENFDAFIVQGWYVKSYLQAIWACWKTNTPVFVRGDSNLNTSRSDLRKLFKYPLYRWLIPKIDAYLYVGQKSKEYYLYYGADEKRMFFSPHAVDNDYFVKKSLKFTSEIEKVKNDLNIPLNSTIYLFVGKLIDIKRPLDFLNALKIACNRNKNVFGIIAGDGKLKTDCINFIEKYNLPALLLGFVNQSRMPEIYSISDVLVMTSESETWGLVVNEAMASRLIVVTSDTVGCAKDLIINNKTGLIYSKGNTKELSELILKLTEDKNLLDTIKINANNHIKNYSIAESVKGIKNALNYLKI